VFHLASPDLSDVDLLPSAGVTLRDVSRLVGLIKADIFVSLDYPPHSNDDASCRVRKIKRSTKNAVALAQRFPHKLIMPVVHGRTIAEIELSVDLIARDLGGVAWIGLGGVVPLLKNRIVSSEIGRMGPEAFIAKSLSIIRSSFPRSKVHVFGAGGTRTFPAVYALGADSADSIGWRQAAGFGSIFLPLRSQRIIRWNASSRLPRRLLDSDDIEQLNLCRCPVCREHRSIKSKLSALERTFRTRSIHNAWTIIHQIDYWPSDRAGVLALLANGLFGSAWARSAG
jgi:tRNA-guanine family transglycosylase